LAGFKCWGEKENSIMKLSSGYFNATRSPIIVLVNRFPEASGFSSAAKTNFIIRLRIAPSIMDNMTQAAGHLNRLA